MMKTIGVFDAKNRLSELIDSGESFTITKHGRPVATLTPIRQDASEVATRIRDLRRSHSIKLSEAQIVALTRADRK